MRTSTLLVSIALTGTIAAVTAANLKLKSEYDQGHIRSVYVKHPLPAFHFIKDVMDTSRFERAAFHIATGQSDSSGVSTYMTESSPFLFDVQNDTLYIRSNPDRKAGEHYYSITEIATPQLDGIDARRGEYTIEMKTSTRFTARASNDAKMKLYAETLNSLVLSARNQARIEIHSGAPVAELAGSFVDRSRLVVNNVTILTKKIQFGADAGLELNGSAITDFGIGKH